MKMLNVSGPFLVAALMIGSRAAAQSQDKDHPTPLTTREISGAFDERDRRELYYSYSAGPGELVITLDVDGGPKRLVNGFVKIDIYDTDFDRLGGLFGQSGMNGASERKVQRYTLDKPVQTIMRITFGDEPGAYKLRLSGTAMDAAGSGKSTPGGSPTEPARDPGQSTPDPGKGAPGAGGLQLPKQGTLTLKMKDGSTRSINLADVESAVVR